MPTSSVAKKETKIGVKSKGKKQVAKKASTKAKTKAKKANNKKA